MDVTVEDKLVAAVAAASTTANGLESTTSNSKKKKAKKRNKSKNIGTNPNQEHQQQQPISVEVDVNSTSTSGKRQNGLLEEATTHENSVDNVSEKLDQALQLNNNNDSNKNGLTNGTVSGSEEHPVVVVAPVTKKRHRNKQRSKLQPVATSGNCQEPSPVEQSAENCPKDTQQPVVAVVAEPTSAPVAIKEEPPKPQIDYREYESELQMPSIMALIQKDLSEPYSIYTYRYFIHNWPRLCFLALHDEKCVGAIVCKLDIHRQNIRRGYIAMLAVDKDYRKLKIGTTLVQKAIQAMLEDDADEVVLETEITNRPALRLYENLGFVRDKRLFHYYLNGVDALRLKLWFR